MMQTSQTGNTARVLLGAGAATALVAIVNGGVEGFLPTLQQAAIGVGGPTAIGILIVEQLQGTTIKDGFSLTDDLMVGVAGVGILMAMGGIDMTLDSGTIGLALMMAGGAASADYIAKMFGM